MCRVGVWKRAVQEKERCKRVDGKRQAIRMDGMQGPAPVPAQKPSRPPNHRFCPRRVPGPTVVSVGFSDRTRRLRVWKKEIGDREKGCTPDCLVLRSRA